MSPDIFTSNKSNPAKKPFAGAQGKPSDASLKQPVGFFSTFCENPEGVSFQNQEHDEVIILFLRKHFITNVPWIATVALLIFLPLFVYLFLISQSFSLISFSNELKTIIIAFYYLLVFAYAYISFITWYYDVFIISQKRIVDIDFSDLIYHHMAITKIELVQDVIYSQTGFLRSFFNYGNLFIQTAGNNPNFDALAIPQPAKAAHIISNLIGKEVSK